MDNKTTEWRPTASDLLWTKMMIDKLKDGGSWGIPATGGLFSIHHSSKHYIYTGADPGNDTDKRAMIALKELGYTRKEKS